VEDCRGTLRGLVGRDRPTRAVFVPYFGWVQIVLNAQSAALSHSAAAATPRSPGSSASCGKAVDAPRTVVFVVLDGAQMIELAGPADIFAGVNHVLGKSVYRLIVASPGGRPVTMQGGLTIGVAQSLQEFAAGTEAIDTMIVIGGGVLETSGNADAIRALPAIARRSLRVVSVCAGAFLLAAAGLLDGYRATTHWNRAHLLARHYPRVLVEPDRIYVHDRSRWTSAGAAAGIDLALALVEADHGAEVAQQVARWFVVYTRRPGGQSQVSAQLRVQPARTPAIRAVQLWLSDHLGEDLGVAALASRAGISERAFARAFRAETGRTPAAYVEDLRVEAAQHLLETTDMTVGAIARAIGYRRSETLHRVIARRLGTTPERYRQRLIHAGAALVLN